MPKNPVSSKTGRPRTCMCGICRKCKHADYMRRWYQSRSPEQRQAWIAARDPIAVRKAAKRYYQQCDKAKHQKLSQAWRRRNGEKSRAHFKAQRALKNGAIQRQPCEVCNTDIFLHMHHDDYAKPLEVRWLCALHHAQLHKRLF